MKINNNLKNSQIGIKNTGNLIDRNKKRLKLKNGNQTAKNKKINMEIGNHIEIKIDNNLYKDKILKKNINLNIIENNVNFEIIKNIPIKFSKKKLSENKEIEFKIIDKNDKYKVNELPFKEDNKNMSKYNLLGKKKKRNL